MLIVVTHDPLDLTLGQFLYAIAIFLSFPVGMVLAVGVIWIITFPWRQLHAYLNRRHNEEGSQDG